MKVLVSEVGARDSLPADKRLYGHVPDAGLPRTFHRAAGRVNA